VHDRLPASNGTFRMYGADGAQHHIIEAAAVREAHG
jgi:hypothetical protein